MCMHYSVTAYAGDLIEPWKGVPKSCDLVQTSTYNSSRDDSTQDV